MAATDDMAVIKRAANTTIPTKSSLTLEGKILEAWGEGFNVGALIILLLIVICNYSKGKILHKLIVLEVRRFNRRIAVSC